MIFFAMSWWAYQWRRLMYWADGQLPARCPACGGWPSKRSMRWAEHRIAGAVLICSDCYQEMYGDE
jgi:hypothetical protein